MLSVAVKVETACGACRMPMPVNTLAREVRCPSCGRPTVLGDGLWKALLRDPLYRGPRLLANEARRSSAGKLSVAYRRRGPRCQGCGKEIPAERIQEVREQATLRCERCAVQTWVRAVPAALAGALPNVTHLVGEEPDQLAGTAPPSAEPATFPCPQCGSPIAFDGVSRACTCRFCNASVHIPDAFVYRGRRRVAVHWYLCFHPSVTADAPAAQAVSAGLFDWEELPAAAVDAEGNLYCAATQSYCVVDKRGDPTEKADHILWSIDPSLNIRWLQRDRPKAERLVLSPRRALLVIGEEQSPHAWLSCDAGTPTGEAIVTAEQAAGDALDCDHLTCDRDGSLLVQKEGTLRRISSRGAAMPVWPNAAPWDDAPDSAEDDDTDAAAAEVDDPFSWSLHEFPGRKDHFSMSSARVDCGPDGSIYLREGDRLTRFDAGGRKVYCVEFPYDDAVLAYQAFGADARGNAYVLGRKQLLRVGAAGEQHVVLESDRDGLPAGDMRIAVGPDGLFWLFGEKGLAWKFDADGRLLFASGKEPRPVKPTPEALRKRRTKAFIAAAVAKEQAITRRMQRAHEEMAKQEKAADLQANVFAWIMVVVTTAVIFAYGTCE